MLSPTKENIKNNSGRLKCPIDFDMRNKPKSSPDLASWVKSCN